MDGLSKLSFANKLGRRTLTIIVTWFAIVGCIIVTALAAGMFFGGGDDTAGSYDYIYGDGTNELLSIQVNGTIIGSASEDNSLPFLGDESYVAGYDVKDQLYAAAEDDVIKGVILDINSPGGTIYGSRAMADGIAYYKKKTHNPVYAFISGEGTSGAYWAAVSADKIIADYGSDIGSIGVIMGPFQYYNGVIGDKSGVLTQKGIENVDIIAGKSKDAGSPYRRLTAEEMQTFQRGVDNEYDNFVQAVATGRKIDPAVIRNKIGALAYDNKTALELGLIDKTANRQDAYEQLAASAKVKDDFTIIQQTYIPSFVESLLFAVTKKPPLRAQGYDFCKLTYSMMAYRGNTAALCQKTEVKP